MSDARRILTPAQARAARALLGWSQSDLAARASVAVPTVTQFERGNRMPTRAIAGAMRAALEAGGVEFIPPGAASPPGGGEGVRLKRELTPPGPEADLDDDDDPLPEAVP